MKPVEDKLNELEKEKTNINDASVAVNYLTQEIRKKVAESVEKANATDSVDERLASLLLGLQSVVDVVNEFGSQHATKVFVLNNKISVLEEVLESYLSNVSEDGELEE